MSYVSLESHRPLVHIVKLGPLLRAGDAVAVEPVLIPQLGPSLLDSLPREERAVVLRHLLALADVLDSLDYHGGALKIPGG